MTILRRMLDYETKYVQVGGLMTLVKMWTLFEVSTIPTHQCKNYKEGNMKTCVCSHKT